MKLRFLCNFEPENREKYPVIETHSRQTASTANKINDLADLQNPHLPFSASAVPQREVVVL